ncbi:MAG: CoA pyrophosphatase [Chitinophagales bacterium]|nr:CoA pyrophosphatase [Chitinophagales bacterium]
MIIDFAAKLSEQIQYLPGHVAQEKMAPEHRLPHAQWEHYFANAKKGGVLILFYPVQTTIHTVLIQRPHYEGVHSGQVAFPGGAKEDADATMIETALREAEEEVGASRKSVQVIGQLTELYIPPSNFLITPVVGFSQQRPDFVLEANEVAGIIEPTLHELLDEKSAGIKKIQVRSDIAIDAPYYDIQGRTVWGATAMMISELNEILKRVSGL